MRGSIAGPFLRIAVYGAVVLLPLGSARPSRAEEKLFPVTTDVTWASEYIMDGFRIGGDHPVLQPSIQVGTPISGVSAMFWSSLQQDRDNQQYDEFDLMARYSREFFPLEKYAFNLHGYYDYWTYPKIGAPSTGAFGGDNMHGSKVSAGVSATHLIPIAGSYLVPSYNLYYWIYWAQNQLDLWQGGAHHELLLEYYHSIPRLFGAQYQYAGVSSSLNYNDGAFGVQPGWSHATASFSTGVYALSFIFSLSINQQWALESGYGSVDPQNEFWTTFSMTKVF